MISVVRRLSFCAGHRVMNHESKCRNLHGHQYELEIFATAPELDPLGRVIDFSVLKDRVGKWIDDHWDHGFILFEKDSEAWLAMEQVEGQKTFSFPYNPTAENIAQYILKVVGPVNLPDSHVQIYKVICHETPNCRAEVYDQPIDTRNLHD
jgi:6-pyruvoyltetrahydropterin/6-carboxytetrahydropterin synthase